MQTAQNYTLRPQLTIIPGSGRRNRAQIQPLMGAQILTALAGLALIFGLIQHNLTSVPHGEVDRIYNNVGQAVQRSFSAKQAPKPCELHGVGLECDQ